MKTHIVTVTVTAPNRLTAKQVQRHVERMFWIGKEDAAETLNNGEGDLDEAKDAMSLHLKFGKPHPLIQVLKEIVMDIEDDQDSELALRRAKDALEDAP